MKKFIIIAFCLFATQFSFAQFDKGYMIIGGDFSVKMATYQTLEPVVQTAVRARAGYFFMDNWASGLMVRLNGGQILFQYSYDIFTRYYINRFFFDVAIGVFQEKQRHLSPLKGLHTSYTIGYSIPLGEKITLEPVLNYDRNYGYEVLNTSDLGIYAGFLYYFDRKSKREAKKAAKLNQD